MWREVIEPFGFHCTFSPPAQQKQLIAVKELFQIELPSELKSLFLETNGIILPSGDDLIWPIDKLQYNNQEMFREWPHNYELCMPFDNMLFFSGDEDCNIAYGYSIKKSGVILSTFIYRWDMETDSRTWVALSLQNYMELVLLGILRLY